MCSKLFILGKSLWKYWSIFEVEKISRIEKFIGMNLLGWKFPVSETLIGWNTGEQKYQLVQTLANPIFLWACNAWWPGIAMILIIFAKGKKGRFDFPWNCRTVIIQLIAGFRSFLPLQGAKWSWGGRFFIAIISKVDQEFGQSIWKFGFPTSALSEIPARFFYREREY